MTSPIAQAQIEPVQDDVVEITDFELTTLPESATDFKLLAAETPEVVLFELPERHGGKFDVSFDVVPYITSEPGNEVFFDMLGVSLGFVSGESGEISLIAYNAHIGEWAYIDLGQVTGINPISVRLAMNAGLSSYGIQVNGSEAIEGLGTADTTSTGEGYFYGNTEADLTVTGFALVLPEEETEDDSKLDEDQRYNNARKLSDFQLPSDGKFVRTGNTLHQLKNRFRDKIASLPERLRNLPADHIIFVDNEIGDDANTGEWPIEHPVKGPKASIKVAVEAVPAGGAVILLPGHELYIEEAFEAPRKQCSLVLIGDNIMGTEQDLIAAYSEDRVMRPQDFMRKFNNAKSSKLKLNNNEEQTN